MPKVAKVVIIVASLTGNTEAIAQELQRFLHGVEVTLQPMELTDPAVLLEADGILLGAYTWGEGELPYEAEQFVEAMRPLVLNGKAAGCFGSGDTDYEQYCAAVDVLRSELLSCGALVLEEGLKLELAPDTELKRTMCKQYAEQFLNLLDQTTGGRTI